MVRKDGAAVLAVCMARTLEQSDPGFADRFQASVERAHDHFRDNHGNGRAGMARHAIFRTFANAVVDTRTPNRMELRKRAGRTIPEGPVSL
jgi:hypothetical protein